MCKRVKNKVVIVTGAGSTGSGIGNGKASSIVYAREGAKVLLVDYRVEAAESTKKIINDEGGECAIFQADVTKSEDCQKMIDYCIKEFGRIDILHNNVGITKAGGAVELSEEDWDRIIDINLKGMFLTCKHALPYMEKQGSGVITNISSVNSIRSSAAIAIAYSASKAGVNALTREIAIQYAAKGIRANAILPGLMDTPMVLSQLKGVSAYGNKAEEMCERRAAMSPTKKQGEPWDVAYAALFLASEEAKYINGTTLIVDGGLSALTTVIK